MCDAMVMHHPCGRRVRFQQVFGDHIVVFADGLSDVDQRWTSSLHVLHLDVELWGIGL